ncbi:MAG: hypothetical protein ACRDTA_26135 [Pseudonocardiaceae bacterium]
MGARLRIEQPLHLQAVVHRDEERGDVPRGGVGSPPTETLPPMVEIGAPLELMPPPRLPCNVGLWRVASGS